VSHTYDDVANPPTPTLSLTQTPNPILTPTLTNPKPSPNPTPNPNQVSDTCDDLVPCVMADRGYYQYMGMTFGLINTVHLNTTPLLSLTAPY
jgi:hypothetical protein